MRYPVALLLLTLPFTVAAPPARAQGAPPAGAPSKGAKLEVSIDRSKVDLKNHQLEVKLSHPADKIRLKVVGESGAVLAELEKTFGGASAGTPLSVSWKPSSEET